MNGWNALAPFPWHVNLYVRTKIEYQFWCGGTLISEAVVVTGSCIYSLALSVELSKVIFNSRSLCVEREEKPVEIVYGINEQSVKRS